MPRLLLVDDNPSIHKIAETLLSSSPIELVCVESGSEAMMLLDSGERFDVALLDTVMPGMDGWELLTRMRKHPESSFIPIAMMAGVLDTVDPNQLSHAPIQGFLKKPIELRELADRVQQLLVTPVTIGERGENGADASVLSPFSTVPGTKISNLPEFRHAVTEDSAVEDDLLVLTPEDFWPGESVPELSTRALPLEAPSPFAEAAVATLMEKTPPPIPLPEHVLDLDSALDLEELDLEALKELHHEEAPAAEVVPAFEVAPEPEVAFAAQEISAVSEVPAPVAEMESSLPTIDLSEHETLAIPGLANALRDIGDLPDLGDVPDFESVVSGSPAPEPSKASLAPLPLDLEPVSPVVPFAPLVSAGPSSLATALEDDHPAPSAMVQALLSDPVLLDALAKAVVGRLGDQVLREIAWEVMPELAEKLPR